MKRKVTALEKIEADRTNLQHKIRDDPASYLEDFRSQYSQYEAHRALIANAPSTADENGLISFRDLIDFVAHVADCYKEDTIDFPHHLIQILTQHHATLEPDLRAKIVGSLVLLSKKGLIEPSVLIETFFPIIVESSSKNLRVLLYESIVTTLRASNSKTKNHRLNSTTQTKCFNIILRDRASPKGLWAVKLTREMWKKQIWVETKAVEIMKEASLAENVKVIRGGVSFFLGGDADREAAQEEDEDEETGPDMKQLRHQMGINKKQKARVKKLKDAAKKVQRDAQRKKSQHTLHPLNFSALHLLHDPQSFAENLFTQHLQRPNSKLNLEQKLLVLQLSTRLIGLHRLTLPALYSYFTKYLTPRQPNVTSFLASLAQATHPLVPPEFLTPLVQKIANEFVSEAVAGAVAAAGLTAIREICARQPLAIDSEALLQDLVQYRKAKDKAVMTAARGLMSLYRDVGPAMLKKKDRGKEAALELREGKREIRFGEQPLGEIEGLELLQKYREEERKKLLESRTGDDEDMPNIDEDDDGWNNWNAEDDDEDSDDSGGWIDVSSEGEDIDISDSDDDKEPQKKKVKFADTASAPAASSSADTSQLPPESNLLTTRILTPADFAKLKELRATAQVSDAMSRKDKKNKTTNTTTASSSHLINEDAVTPHHIESATGRRKDSKDAEGSDDEKDKHLGKIARRKARIQEKGKSTTNEDKARRKNVLMTLGKAKRKGKRSLQETRRAMRGHVERKKRGGRRGNR